MVDVKIDNITRVVTDALGKDIAPRNREIMLCLLQHMHAFAAR